MAPSFDNGSSLFDFVVRDGNGVKGMVDSGISKVPQAYVQPPAEQINKKNASKHGQPPIDLSKLDGPDHDQVAQQIVKAAETLGFLQVVNHGVPVDLLESLKDTAHHFFSLPAERKAVYRAGVSPTPLVKYGTSFVPEKEKALEWKDYISMVYTNDDEALQHWPAEDVALEYLRTSLDMVKKLLHVLMGNLLGVELDESKIDSLIAKKIVKMNYYPTCPNPELTVGVGRHSDMGTLTILLQDGIGGLYVNIPEDAEIGKKGEWVEIPPTPGALVINIGDMLQNITTSTKSRVSIPIFTIPKPTEKIGPLPQVVEKDGIARYREFVLADYMNNFFTNPHEGKKSLDFAKI
ncbi:Oxoglutarate/iron-dependent dioxygenase [Corchorus olitorius]|uniref:Oxoglutarate/iron-dependent dioxygenase n=1 Tax=Corchorus olitorius TaxID=93759 RepID=A0A1R3G5Z0_9ROSI|nr:Oxoglutarate/iron-dependent dioxygenase [Corchorus olitorius]